METERDGAGKWRVRLDRTGTSRCAHVWAGVSEDAEGFVARAEKFGIGRKLGSFWPFLLMRGWQVGRGSCGELSRETSGNEAEVKADTWLERQPNRGSDGMEDRSLSSWLPSTLSQASPHHSVTVLTSMASKKLTFAQWLFYISH